MVSFEVGSSQRKDFFEGTFETRPSLIVAVSASFLGIIIGASALSGIIYHGLRGPDENCTLIRRLISSLSWGGLEYLFMVTFSDNIRALSGPFTESYCDFTIIMRLYGVNQLSMFISAILLSKYVYVFWLKNPMAFKDKFWALFITLWIKGASLLWQIGTSFFPDRSSYYFFICSGLSPETYPLSKFKQRVTPFLIFVAMFLYFTVGVKIKIYKKGTTVRTANSTFHKLSLLFTNEDKELVDVTINVCQIVVLLVTLLTLLVTNRLETDLYNVYPFYLLEYFLRLFWPPALIVFLSFVYYRPRNEIKRFLKDRMVNLHGNCL